MDTHTPRNRSQKLGIGGLALLACIAVALCGLIGSPRAAHAAVGDYGTLEDGTYVISSYYASTQGYSKCWDIANGSKDDGTKVQSWQNNETGAQRWRITTDSDGYSTIVNAQSGKALDVPGCSIDWLEQLWIWHSIDYDAQKWKITEDENGYKIASALNESYVIDLAYWSTNDGAMLILTEDGGAANQRWTFEKCTEDALNVSDEQTELFDTSVYITDVQAGTLVVENLSSGWEIKGDIGTYAVLYYSLGLYSGSPNIKVRVDKVGKVNGRWVSIRLTFNNLKASSPSPNWFIDEANEGCSTIVVPCNIFQVGTALVSLDQGDVSYELLDYYTGSPISLKGSFASFGSLNYGSGWGTEGVGYISSNDYKTYLLTNNNLKRSSLGIWSAISTDGWQDDMNTANYNRNTVSFGIADDTPTFRFVFPNNDEAFAWISSFSPLTIATPPSPTKSATITG